MSGATVWTGGRVFTGARYVEALLVEDGHVAAAGADYEVRRLAPTGAEHRPLAGRAVVPGLVDAHVHLTEIARLASGPDVSGGGSLEEILGRLAAWAEAHPTGAIVGRGWDPERCAHHRWPDAADLDRVVPHRPVVLYHASGHAAVANTAALEDAGVDPAAPAPDAPDVGRRSDGRPSGLLFEDAMRPLARVAAAGSPIGPDRLARTVDELPAFGITAAGAMSSPPEEVEAFGELAAAGRLSITVRAYVRLSDRSLGARRRADGPAARFGVVGTKAFLDGAFGTRTAWLSEPYADAPEHDGIAVGEEGPLGEALADAVDLGLAPALHAIGDRAVERALRILAPLQDRAPAPVRIEHASLTPDRLLAAIDQGQPTLVVQPGFVWSDGWLADRLGAGRARQAYRFRTLSARGARLAASSDAPFDPVDPWRGIRAATRRRGPDGRSANPDPGETIPVEEAIRLYSSAAADALGLDGRGRLEAGAPGDLVVLRSPRIAAALDAPGAPVDETWIAGRCVYRAPSPSIGKP